MFQLWSQKNKEAKEALAPNLGLRDWLALNSEEKDKIWYFLQGFFLNESQIFSTILELNELHKYHAFGTGTLRSMNPASARDDFHNIFYREGTHVVLELLSCFCSVILDEQLERRNNTQDGIRRSSEESDEEWQRRFTEWRYEEFDRFTNRLNDVFEHFGINVVLTRSGFIERQEPKITNEIYIPVLNFLSLPKWQTAERELRDAFKEYRQKTEHGYSNCITHAISGLEAFLQIVVDGKTGSSEGLTSLITKAKEKKILPADKFSQEVFENIKATLLRERGKTGDGHPKQEYANEKSARLVLNLMMVFMQHCLQNQ